jgi:hypothetical protein
MYHFGRRWHPDKIGAGNRGHLAKVDALPAVVLNAGLGILNSRLNSPGSTAEGLDGKNTRLLASQELIAGLVGSLGASSAIQYVRTVLSSVIPEAGWALRHVEIGSHVLHYGSDGSLCDAIEFVHVRWTRGVRDQLRVQKLSELTRQEFASVVCVESSHDTGGVGTVAVHKLVQLSYIVADFARRFTLLT